MSFEQLRLGSGHDQWIAKERGERPIVHEDNGTHALCSIVQHEELKFRQLNHEEILEFTNLDGLEQIHRSNDVVFFDSLCELANPSKSYQDYIQFIKHPDPVSRYNPGKCGFDQVSPVDEMTKAYINGYSAYRCKGSGNVVYVPKYEAGKYSPYSKAVSNRNSSNRAASQLCKLPEASGINDLYLMGWDLTLPKEISMVAMTDPKKAEDLLNKAAKEFVKILIKKTTWIRKKDQKLGYVANNHLWHTHHSGDFKEISTPDEPHLHIHMNFVNLVVRNAGKGEPEYIRFNPHVSRDLINECWSYAIFKTFNVLVVDPVFYLHYVPLKSRARISHRLRYCGRSPMNDLFDYYQDNDFNQDIPKEFNEYLTEYDNRRHAYGFLRHITKLVGEIEAEKVCPVCVHPSEKLEPLSNQEMYVKVYAENIPIAIYRSRSRQVAIIRKGGLNDTRSRSC